LLSAKKLSHRYEKKYKAEKEEKNTLIEKIKEFQPEYVSPIKKKKPRRRHTV